MKAKRQIESSLNSVTMLDGAGGHVRWSLGSDSHLYRFALRCDSGAPFLAQDRLDSPLNGGLDVIRPTRLSAEAVG